MKKIVMMCAVVMSAWAGFAVELWTDPSTGITYKYVVKDDGVKLKGYGATSSYPSGDYVVPSRIAGLPVVEIGGSANLIGYELTSVTIPPGVKRIGDYAIMMMCDSVVLPEGLTHIGEGNFQNVNRVKIPASVVEIGEISLFGAACDVDPGNQHFCSVDGVLFNKQKTELIRFPRGRTGMYQVPEGVTRIGKYAFYGYGPYSEETLSSILLPKSLQSIERYAFTNCHGLKSITIPAGVTSIAGNSLLDCTKLSSIIVDPGNKNYCSVDGVLFNSKKTELVKFPDARQGSYQIPTGVKVVGNAAFYSCAGLTGVTIPSGVTSIENSAFYKCTGLTSVMIPSSVTSIESGAFAGCTGLTSVMVPSSVKSIGRVAFEGCTGLTSVTLPASIKLDDGVFYGCRGLAKDGFVIFSGILFDAFDKSGHLVVPNGVTHIGEHFPSARYSGSDITAVTIPSSVKSIGRGAFEDCQKLTTLNIPSSVKDIGQHAFSGCTGLTDENGFVIVNGVLCDANGRSGEVVVPDGVTKIGYMSFISHDITDIVLPSTATIIDKCAFYHGENLKSITIPSSVKSIGEDAFWEDDDLAYVYVDKGDTKRVKKMIEESGFDTSDLQFIEGSEPGPTPPPGPEPEPEEGFEEAHTFNGLVYEGEVMCGIIQVTTGRRTAKDQVKVGGFVMLADGKKQTIKSVTEDIEGGKLNVETKAGKLGDVELEITDNGFTGSVGLMTVKSGDIGEDTGIISGTLKMSYFDAKTNKLKTRSIKLGGVASEGEAAGTLDTKGEDTTLFEAAIYPADVAD